MATADNDHIECLDLAHVPHGDKSRLKGSLSETADLGPFLREIGDKGQKEVDSQVSCIRKHDSGRLIPLRSLFSAAGYCDRKPSSFTDNFPFLRDGFT